MEEDVKPLDEPLDESAEETVDVANEPSVDTLKSEMKQLREEMRQLRETLTGGVSNE